MLSLTRKADYALVGLVDLARRTPGKASARQIAESSGVPLPMLMNILKELLAGGLVCSTRGVNGGYRLAKELMKRLEFRDSDWFRCEAVHSKVGTHQPIDGLHVSFIPDLLKPCLH